MLFLHTYTGVAVIRPGCENRTDISVNSSIIAGNSAGAVVDSAITLPPTVFGMMSNCSNVGVVVVISDGIGPLLSSNEQLPTCLQPTEVLVHGKW